MVTNSVQAATHSGGKCRDQLLKPWCPQGVTENTANSCKCPQKGPGIFSTVPTQHAPARVKAAQHCWQQLRHP